MRRHYTKASAGSLTGFWRRYTTLGLPLKILWCTKVCSGNGTSVEQIQVKIFKVVFSDFPLVLPLFFLPVTMSQESRELDSKNIFVFA